MTSRKATSGLGDIMSAHFFNLNDPTQGLHRELAPGVTARVFGGDHVMLSVVTLEPNASGILHSHPEEQWGVLLEGDGVRVQGDQETPVRVNDFWRTPGGVAHTLRAGAGGARVLDIFSLPREEYRPPGAGFGTDARVG